MNKRVVLFAILFLILAAGVLLTGRFLFQKDAWVCQDGKWIQRGNPSEPKPSEACGKQEEEEIASFQDCIDAGFPVSESYPRQCRTDEGETFTEEIGNELEKSDIIRIDTPRPNEKISSPLTIKGEARGAWYFEGEFPVALLSEDGNVLAEKQAVAQDEWMTENFVDFETTLNFESTEGEGVLVLNKANPSGKKENADSLEIPVKFNN
ncbi:MAG: Gmad2 immunoglobulin-like domain-containing protein [Candidatus Moraniibacteriota bacterium]